MNISSVIWGALAIVALPLSLQAAESNGRRPNILLFFPDQHRYDWTSMNPRLPDITPNLMKLSRAGVHFSDAICPSPLCAPSRACFASGREYARCGVVDNGEAYPKGVPTVYSLLKASGYRVMACGKFDLDKPGMSWGVDGKHMKPRQTSEFESWGFTDGIDNEGKMDGWSAHGLGKDGPYFAFLKSRNLVDAYKKNYTILNHDYEGTGILPEEAYCDNWIGENGLKLLSATPKGVPWFLQVNFDGPHEPMDVTKTMYEKWKDVKFPEVKYIGPKTRGDATAKRRNYAAMINNIDRWLGVYRDELTKRGELDNTIIIYCSDHGDMLGDHGYWSKHRPLHPSAAVPLVLSGPGIQANRTCSTPVETLDLTATILDYAGLRVPEDMDSKSLRAYLEGRGELIRSSVQSALEGWRLVYDGRFKLICGQLKGKVAKPDGGKTLVLYDLKNDPAETTDVAAQYPDVVAKLQAEMRSKGE